jgi:hypothetical protein
MSAKAITELQKNYDWVYQRSGRRVRFLEFTLWRFGDAPLLASGSLEARPHGSDFSLWPGLLGFSHNVVGDPRTPSSRRPNLAVIYFKDDEDAGGISDQGQALFLPDGRGSGSHPFLTWDFADDLFTATAEDGVDYALEVRHFTAI